MLSRTVQFIYPCTPPFFFLAAFVDELHLLLRWCLMRTFSLAFRLGHLGITLDRAIRFLEPWPFLHFSSPRLLCPPHRCNPHLAKYPLLSPQLCISKSKGLFFCSSEASPPPASAPPSRAPYRAVFLPGRDPPGRLEPHSPR